MARITHDYIIDLKVYNNIPQEEIALLVPLELLRRGKLPEGIYQLAWNTSEGDIETFANKVFNHPDMKIIGIHLKP